MPTEMTKRHRKLVAKLSPQQLDLLVQKLHPQVRESRSLLSCAQQELINRAQTKRKEVNNAEPS